MPDATLARLIRPTNRAVCRIRRSRRIRHLNIRSYMRRFRSHRPGLTVPDRPARLQRRHGCSDNTAF
ncbi:mannitol-1-phosphate 5-dehydrogenase [Escherichia coli]|nr:mannitol-1-phosphate 5-dehydrogenase [Escherichia coli]AHM49097.1 mannitol-1-phosphate 5-dehydrogenase [Escherichia coli]AHM53560.1 mannitol-1-phosphate 5-dehydrogenase [Escherichia coli]